MAGTNSAATPQLPDRLIEHEVANIGRLTITVEHYQTKLTKEWNTTINLLAYDNHLVFGIDTVRELAAALNKAIIIAEGYEGR